MFICAPCHRHMFGGPGLHNESRGTCEVCMKSGACADCPGHTPRRAADPRIQTVPVASTPLVRTSPAGAHARGSTATPAAALFATCRHCGEKIRMNKGTDYWFHVRTQMEECGP